MARSLSSHDSNPKAQISALEDQLAAMTARVKTLEQQLHQQSTVERLNLVTEAMKSYVYDFDFRNNRNYPDCGFFGVTGYQPEEMPEDPERLRDYIHPEDLLRVNRSWKQALADPQCDRWSMEFRLKHKDGHYIDLLDQTVFIRDDQGTVVRAVGNCWDVSDRKQAEKALQQSEAQFRSIFEQNTVSSAIMDEQARFVQVNQAYCELLGYSESELLGKSAIELTYPSDQFKCAAVINAIKQKYRSSYRIEKRYIRKDGQLRWVSIYVTSALTDFMISTAVDITSYKEAELRLQQLNQNLGNLVQEQTQALQKNEELFRRLFDEAPIGIAIVHGKSGQIEQVNQEFCNMLGYSVEELQGVSYRDISDARDLALEAPYVEQVLAQVSTGYQIEKRYIRKNGKVFWAQLTSRVLSHQAPQSPLYTLGMIEDISDRKQAEQLLQDQQLQLQASLEEKDILLKEVHHRVKNNLQIISSLLQMQTRRISDEPIAMLLRESCNRIQSIALIHEQLYQSSDLSKIIFSEYLDTLIAHLFVSYGIRANRVAFSINSDNKYLTLNTAIPCGLIVTELVSNALKYAFPQGQTGSIKIELHHQSNPENTIGRLVVADDGIGLPIDLDWQNTQSLGLLIVKNLVKQIKGSITLDRSTGCHFEICFPLDQPKS